MKRLLKLFLWLLLLSPLLLVGVLLWSIEDAPSVNQPFALTPEQVKRAKALVAQHDPRKAREGEVKSVSLTTQELNLVSSYLFHTVNGVSVVTVQPDWLDLQASVPVPGLAGRYVNFRVGLRETSTLPRFRYLQLGKVPVPNLLSDFVLQQSLDALYSRSGYEGAADVVQKVALASGRMQVTYQWHSAIGDAVRSTLISSADQDRLRLFQHRLAEAVNANGSSTLRLEEVVQPLFQLAAAIGHESDAIEDNRAALVVLAAFAKGSDLSKLAPEVTDWKPVKPVELVSHGRSDLPKHFLISAGVAVTGGSALANAIGLFKEVDDSQGGSGFSFTDLLADNAGTRLGELATGSQRTAVALQREFARPVSETDLIPDLSGLPDGLTEQQFRQRYGEVGSPAYRDMLQVIEQRIAGSRLYN